MANRIEDHGWTALPRSLDKLIAGRPKRVASRPVKVEDIPLPDTALVKRVQAYAREKLPAQTYNHCMRVYYFGQAVTTQHFPHLRYSPETFLLAALLHDIGTTAENQTSTRMSFEFFGGFLALELLKSNQVEVSQAETVCETIIRHRDLGTTGNVSTLTAVIQLATVPDNAGLHAELVADETIKSVVAAFPRNGWTGCFAAVVRKEGDLKPWANTSWIEGFADMVEANTLMEQYDQ